MHLSGIDLLLWLVGFLENLGLLTVLVYRRRAERFPFFTALITLNVIRTIVLYLVLRYSTKDGYFYSYWSLSVVDTILQLCVIYEVASRVHNLTVKTRPGDVEKISVIRDIIAENVDVNKILRAL